jgi:hypothetical protein
MRPNSTGPMGERLCDGAVPSELGPAPSVTVRRMNPDAMGRASNSGRKPNVISASPAGRLTIFSPLYDWFTHAMIRRRAAAAGIATSVGNHTFRATGITAYLKTAGRLRTRRPWRTTPRRARRSFMTDDGMSSRSMRWRGLCRENLEIVLVTALDCSLAQAIPKPIRAEAHDPGRERHE